MRSETASTSESAEPAPGLVFRHVEQTFEVAKDVQVLVEHRLQVTGSRSSRGPVARTECCRPWTQAPDQRRRLGQVEERPEAPRDPARGGSGLVSSRTPRRRDGSGERPKGTDRRAGHRQRGHDLREVVGRSTEAATRKPDSRPSACVDVVVPPRLLVVVLLGPLHRRCELRLSEPLAGRLGVVLQVEEDRRGPVPGLVLPVVRVRVPTASDRSSGCKRERTRSSRASRVATSRLGRAGRGSPSAARLGLG